MTPFFERRKLIGRVAAFISAAALLAACGTGTTKDPEHQSSQPVAAASPSPEASVTPSEIPEKAPVQNFGPEFDSNSEQAWSMDFSKMPNGPIDPNIWNYDLDPAIPGWNKEAQIYTDRPENVRIEDGSLVLEARKDGSPEHPYTSARITTLGKKDITYGAINITAKLSTGMTDGTKGNYGAWPALWMLPSGAKYKVNLADGSPDYDTQYKKNGELDIMEYVGHEPGRVHAAIHTFDTHKNTQGVGTTEAKTVANLSDTYQTYGIRWTPDKVVFTLNNEPYLTYKKSPQATADQWPFDQPYHLVMNLAVGGNWGGEKGISPSLDDWKMSVKNISYAPLKP